MSTRAPILKPRNLHTCSSRPPAVLSVQQRRVHSSRPRNAVVAAVPDAAISTTPSKAQGSRGPSSLSILPTSSMLRTYLITRMSASPVLLRACFALLRRMLDSKTVLMNPERNFALRWLFKRTFYAQFCAGENKKEVQQTADSLKQMGYSGVILEFALEVLGGEVPSAAETAKEIEVFRKGMHETIEMASPGDFIGMKWSGLGREALHRLMKNQPPTPAMLDCIHEICDAAKAKGANFLPGAEEESNGVNSGVDSWTLAMMQRYNKDRPFMYNTYQAYLKSTPGRLAQHLAMAEKEGFMPGVKVVRGAYLLSEPKSAVRGSWEETNKYYDGIVEVLLKRRWNEIMPSSAGDLSAPFPKLGLMLATHNAESIRRARAIRDEQVRNGEERVELAYAQLQGMADEISCELVAASRAANGEAVDKPRPFKAATWGTLGECMNFLIRRASENQDAMGRTVETNTAMYKELKRRLFQALRLS